MEVVAPVQFTVPSKIRRGADQIAARLVEYGFQALYAGGWVRDLLMGRPGEDIDIATDASPDELLLLFPKAIQVGIAFGVLCLVIDGIQFEIATFRKDAQYLDGRHPTSISLTTSVQEDALRRDFTVNGIFYDPHKNVLLDYVHGIEDIHKKVLRTIGLPQDRFSEDRLRIIRALRFKNSLGFTMDAATWEAIEKFSQDTVNKLSPERIWQEFRKMDEKGVLGPSLRDLAAVGLLRALFPMLHDASLEQHASFIEGLTRSQEKVSTALVFAVLLGQDAPFLQTRFHLSNEEKKAIETTLATQAAFDRGLHTHSEREVVELLARPHVLEASRYLALLSEGVACQSKRLEELSLQLRFWSDQLIHHSFHVAGRDFLQRGVLPGTLVGRLVEHAFTLSLTSKETDKEMLIQRAMEVAWREMV